MPPKIANRWVVLKQQYAELKVEKRVTWASKEDQERAKRQKSEFPDQEELARRAQAVVDTDPGLMFWIASPDFLCRIGQPTGLDLLARPKK